MDRRAAFVTLVVWVVLAPLLWGSVPEVGTTGQGWLPVFRDAGGPYALFRILGYLALAFLLPSLLGHAGGAEGTRTGWRMLTFLLGLLLLAAFQLLPLPVGIYGVLAPGHAADLSVLAPEAGWAPISIDPGYTGRAVVYLFTLLCAATLVFHAVRTTRRAWILIGAVVGTAALGAAYGLLETVFLGNGVLGVPKQDIASGVSGTLFYPSNFAALAAAGLGLSVVGLIQAFRSGRAWPAAGAAMALVLFAVALLLSRSRAGLAAGGLALAVGVALSLRSRRFAAAAFLAVLVVAAGAGLAVSSLRERFSLFGGEGGGRPFDMRTSAWASSLGLAAGRPAFGAGLGTFRRAIHLTQRDDTPEELYFAHSDPLNLLAEGGAVGLLLGLALVLTGGAVAFRLARDREHEGHGPGAACAAGLTGLFVMALVDFPLEIPAIALVFFCLLFLPVALKSPSPRPRSAAAGRLWLARIVSLAAVGLLAIGVGEDVRRRHEEPGVLTRGELFDLEGRRLGALDRIEEAREKFEEARDLQPFEGATRFHLASALYRERKDLDRARREVRAAYHIARGRARLLYRIGYLSVGDPKLADLTDAAFREASALDPHLFPRILALPELPTESLKEIVPEDPALLDLLGRHFAHLERHEDALEMLLRAVRLGGRGEVVKRLAAAYRRLDREPEGRRKFAALGLAWPE